MQKPVPFIVFGASKSGTTWLQKIINEHPDCICYFQIPVFPLSEELLAKLNEDIPMAYSDRQSPFKGLFDTKEEEKRYSLMKDFLRSRDFLKSDYISSYIKGSNKKYSASDKEYLEKLHHSIIRGVSKELLADGQKKVVGTKAYTDIDHYFEVFPEGKMLCIIRDGRDVVISKRFHALRMNAYMHGDERSPLLRLVMSSHFIRKALAKINMKVPVIKKSAFHHPPDSGKLIHKDVINKYGSEWKKIVAYILESKKKVGDKLLVLKYEDLKSEPEETIRHIFEFLNVKASPEIIKTVVANTNIAKLKKDDGNGFFRKGIIGDWKNYFSQKDKTNFKRIAGDMLIQLGYETSANW